MQDFRCKECPTRCTLTIKDDALQAMPEGCPFNLQKPVWKRIRSDL